MKRLVLGGLAACVAVVVGVQLSAQATPYKLGTFQQRGRTFVGLVLNDTMVLDLAQANQAFEQANPSAPKVALPREMKPLLAAYGTANVAARLGAIASAAAAQRPAYAQDVKALKTLPPVMPQNILNAAVNYTEHAQEMAGRDPNAPAAAATAKVPDSIPGIWIRKPGDTRHNPYVFPKPVGTVIGDGDTIRLPPDRPQVDWECELAIVIGRTADHVPVERAGDYIVGYTVFNDVSDRGGRADGRHGSDWFIGKGHATFGPLGPFIVPKQFVADPQKLPIKYTLSGKVMQDSSTERMTHTVYEMVSFVSNILALRPGDVISTGSPAGVGAARNVFMKSGDTSVCSVGSIGTITNPVSSAPSSTAGGR